MAYRRIVLKGDGIPKEIKCSVAVTPGMLLTYATDGTVKPHATAAGIAFCKVALPNLLCGKGVDDAYAIGEIVTFTVPVKGDEFAGRVAGAVAVGDYLVSDGAGAFKTAAGTETAIPNIVGIALEAGTDTLVRIEAV